MKSRWVRRIQRRNPFQIETIPWIARVYRQPMDKYSSFARQALFGAPNFLVVWLGKKFWPFAPQGVFKYKANEKDMRISFDARNTQFSALYLKSYSGGYEAQISTLIDLLMPVDGVFLDIGSNWGWFSLLVASKTGFRGQIHAFEPFHSSFRDLSQMVEQANLGDRIRCHEVALSDRIGRGSMILPDKFQSGQATLHEAGGEGGVNTVTLDSLNLPSVSVIKMDVEGAEAKVIKGAIETLKRHRPMIVFENGRHFSEVSRTLEPLYQLKELGYQFYQAGWLRSENGRPYFLGDDDDTDPQPQEILCLTQFEAEERFMRANGINVFACHEQQQSVIESVFQPYKTGDAVPS